MSATLDDILLQAAMLLDQGAHDKALAKLSALLEQQAIAAAHHLRSRCHRALGDDQAALADLNASLEIEPDNADAYLERAQLHFLSRRHDLALVDNKLAEHYLSLEAGKESEQADNEEVEGPDLEGSDNYGVEERDELFNRVYEAREGVFQDTFGPVPSDVLKLNNMIGVWPGGCLVEISAEHLPEHPVVTSTFGLTNPDMPATMRGEEMVLEERAEEGRLLRSTTMKLVERSPASVPPGLAGYGYETVILTPDRYDWPALFLSWFVTNEINHDAGWLKRVMQEEAVLLKCPLSRYPRLKMLLSRVTAPIPDTVLLPNGMAYLLVATCITEGEYAFGMKAGAIALLDALRCHGPGQMSIIFRPSCV